MHDPLSKAACLLLLPPPALLVLSLACYKKREDLCHIMFNFPLCSYQDENM